MNFSNFIFPSAVGLLCFSLAQRPAHADLVTYFNFNDGNFTSDIPSGGPTPDQTTTITTNNGGNGIFNFSTIGTTQNRLGTDPAGSALTFIILTPTPSPAYFQFQTDLSRFIDPTLTYASGQRNGTASDLTLSYSTDGGATFTTFGTDTIPVNPTSADPPVYQTDTYDLSSFNAVDNQSNVIFRFGGFNPNAANSFSFDNIQLNATATPEPETWAMMGLGVVALSFMGWRRKRGQGEVASQLAI